MLTQNVLLLQRRLEKEVKNLKEKLKKDFKSARDKTNGDLQKMKVSFPTYTIKCVPLYSHSISAVLMSPVHINIIISCILGAIILIILHLNYQKLH